MCPVTNLYVCSDGQHLLVTAKAGVMLTLPDYVSEGLMGTNLGALATVPAHAPHGVEVFLADLDGHVLDADGNPANGMTALWSTPDDISHEAALAAIGRQVVDVEIPEMEPFDMLTDPEDQIAYLAVRGIEAHYDEALGFVVPSDAPDNHEETTT